MTYSSDIPVTITDKVFLHDTLETYGMVGVEETTVEFPEGTGNFFDLIDEYKLTEVSVQ